MNEWQVSGSRPSKLNDWVEGAKPTTPLTGFFAPDLDQRGEPLRARRRRSGS